MRLLILAFAFAFAAFGQPIANLCTTNPCIVKSLPSAAQSTVGVQYIWTGAGESNTCPSGGAAGGTLGSATAICLTTDNVNWQSVGGGGSVTTCGGSTTTNCFAEVNGSGVLPAPGPIQAGTSAGVGGAVDLPAGTDPGGATGVFSLIGPASLGSGAYRWQAPTADAAGAVTSDGGATPGHLTITPIATTSTNNSLVKTNSSGKIDPSFITGGGGGGTTISAGSYASKPACSTSSFLYLPTDWILNYFCDGSSNLTATMAGQTVTPPGLLTSYTVVTGSSNPSQLKDGIYFKTSLGEFSLIGIQSSTTVGSTTTVEAAFSTALVGGGCGPAFIVNDTTYYRFALAYGGYGSSFSIDRVVSGTGTNLWASNALVNTPVLKLRLRATATNSVIAEVSYDGQTWSDPWGLGTQDFSAVSAVGTVKAGFACNGQDGASTLYHLVVN